jgi:hypothetical protein
VPEGVEQKQSGGFKSWPRWLTLVLSLLGVAATILMLNEKNIGFLGIIGVLLVQGTILALLILRKIRYWQYAVAFLIWIVPTIYSVFVLYMMIVLWGI